MFQNLMPCLNGQSYVWYHESHVSHMFQNLMPCLNGQSYVWYHESHVSHMIQIKCHMLNMGSHMFGTICHMFHMFLSYEAYVCHMFAKKYSFLDIFLILQNVPVSYVSVICHMVFIWFSYVFHMFVICRLPSNVILFTTTDKGERQQSSSSVMSKLTNFVSGFKFKTLLTDFINEETTEEKTSIPKLRFALVYKSSTSGEFSACYQINMPWYEAEANTG